MSNLKYNVIMTLLSPLIFVAFILCFLLFIPFLVIGGPLAMATAIFCDIFGLRNPVWVDIFTDIFE